MSNFHNFKNPRGFMKGYDIKYPLAYFKNYGDPGVYIFHQTTSLSSDGTPKYWLYRTNDRCSYNIKYFLDTPGYGAIWKKADLELINCLDEFDLI